MTLKFVGDQDTGRVPGVVISASGHEGLSATVNGTPARLALVLDDGSVVEGAAIAEEVFAVSANAYRDYLRGEGHLRTVSPPVSSK